MRKALLLLFLFLNSCTSTPTLLKRGELKDTVLKPHTGYVDHLVNQTCAKYTKGTSECEEWDVVKFHLADRATRDRLRSLKFHCNVNGERFRICENSRGLCQQTIIKGGWFKKDEIKLLRYLSGVKDYQYLIDSKVKCAAQESKAGKRLFD